MSDGIITRLMGGLGNQMFQYALGRAVSLQLGVELKLDCSWFDAIAAQETPRRYMLGDAFAVAVDRASEEECGRLRGRREHPAKKLLRRLFRRQCPTADTFVQEPHFAYWPGIEAVAAPAYLLGYWQNERYFSAVAERIRQDFAFPALSQEAEAVAQDIREANVSVCVHVRRGDYVSSPRIQAFYGVCSPEYYKKAMAAVSAQTGEGLKLFLFSDDAAWFREHFDCRGFPAFIVDFSAHADAPWHDMHLMSLCRHHIIANSSFSWWGAWLASGEGVTVAPRRWFAEEGKADDNPAPDGWILL